MIILASSSPRRKEIMDLIGLPYKIIPSNFDESSLKVKNVSEIPLFLSFYKAMNVYENNKEDIVIGSDTIVVIDDKVLGKPKDKNDAYEMLKLLSNRTHKVITGVSIISKNKTISFNSIAKVRFKKISEEEIIKYIETNEPMDKAGSYAVQGEGSKFIKKIYGDYYTVMGLPKDKLEKKLKKIIG